jgi:hypothetical protein
MLLPARRAEPAALADLPRILRFQTARVSSLLSWYSGLNPVLCSDWLCRPELDDPRSRFGAVPRRSSKRTWCSDHEPAAAEQWTYGKRRVLLVLGGPLHLRKFQNAKLSSARGMDRLFASG